MNPGGFGIATFGSPSIGPLDDFHNSKVNAVPCYVKAARYIVPISAGRCPAAIPLVGLNPCSFTFIVRSGRKDQSYKHHPFTHSCAHSLRDVVCSCSDIGCSADGPRRRPRGIRLELFVTQPRFVSHIDA